MMYHANKLHITRVKQQSLISWKYIDFLINLQFKEERNIYVLLNLPYLFFGEHI